MRLFAAVLLSGLHVPDMSLKVNIMFVCSVLNLSYAVCLCFAIANANAREITPYEALQ